MAGLHRTSSGRRERPGEAVPSTEIVRNFAAWQERSAERPVTILHHGRPRSVLLSLDRYGELLAGLGSQDEREEALRRQLATLLAHMDKGFVQLDRALRVVRANPAAAAWLGCSQAALDGRTLDEFLPAPMARPLRRAARKAASGGESSRVSIGPGAGTERAYSIDVAPFAQGAALFCADVTRQGELEELRALRAATEDLLGMMTGCAVGEAGPDGTLRGVHASLRRLVRFGADDIAGRRFPDLFAQGARRKCALHLDHVIEGRGPVCCRAELLTRDRGAVPVRLFIAPKTAGDRVEGAVFSILDDSLGALPMR